MRFFESPPDTTSDDTWSAPGIKAAIDIGTNTVLLLIAKVASGVVTPLLEMQRTPRLGAGMQRDAVLHPDKMHQVIMVLHEFRELIAREYGDIPVRVTATSAVRDASNKIEFLWMIEEATGYRISILTGAEESRHAFHGALSTLDTAKEQVFTIDIGGGSTEIAYLDAAGEMKVASYDIGSVRLTERFLANLPALQQDYEDAGNMVGKIFSAYPASGTSPDWRLLASREAVGIAGTATSLAAIKLGQSVYSAEKLNDTRIDTEFVLQCIQNFRVMSANEILQVNPGIMQGRQDIILAGLIILMEILKRADASGFTVTTGGIRHGVLLQTDF